MIEGLDPLSGGMDGSGSGKPLTGSEASPREPDGILPDFVTVAQCNVVAGAWDFCQRMKADYPGTAKAATAEAYLRRTFATLRKDIVNCIMAEGPAERSEAGTNPPGNPPVPPAPKGAA